MKKEKLVLASTGKEVKVGDKIKVDTLLNTSYGVVFSNAVITVTENSVKKLVDSKILKVMNKNSSEINAKIPMEIEYYVQKVADKMGWHIDKTYNYLNNIDSIFPMAAFSIVLREIAVELDKQYEDHIENSPEIYAISSGHGRITKANKSLIKNYRNFSAFRSVEDAKVACKIMRDFLKGMFSGK